MSSVMSENDVVKLSANVPAVNSVASQMEMATMLSKSNVVPQCYQNKPANVFAALQMAKEIGVQPMAMLKNSFPVNDRITIMTDLMGAIVKQHPQYGGIEIIEHTPEVFRAKIKRVYPNFVEEYETVFTIQEAKIAGLLDKSGPWRHYPKVMLKHRALAYGWRQLFPDLLAGVYTKEESDSFTPGAQPLKNVTPDPENGDVSSIDTSVWDDPIWDALYVKIKQARLGDKQEAELRKRYDATATSERARKNLMVNLHAEVDDVLATQGAQSGTDTE